MLIFVKTFTILSYFVIIFNRNGSESMNLKKNEIEIIKLLLSSSNYISSYDIATATGINRRLVRDEMSNIKNILKSLGYELISKTSNGYIIRQRSSESLKKLSKIIEEAERKREYLLPTLPWERRNYIVKRLIDENDYMKIDQLADELLISRSTISNDIKASKLNIKKYNLSFKQKPNYGICIVGEEVDKRKPICDYMFANLTESEMHYDYLNNFISQKDSLEYGIITILKNHDIEITDIALCDFLLSLSVNISRIIANQSLTKSPDLKPIEGRKELDVAKKIAEYIESRTHIHFNTYEVNQIAIQLVCKRSTRGLIPTIDERKNTILNRIYDEIYQKTLIRFNDDNKRFSRILSLYIDTYFLCAHFNEKIRNPLYDTLKESYPLAYELAVCTLSILEEYSKASSYDSSAAMFTTLYNVMLNQKDKPKLKVMLLNGISGSSALLNSQLILKRFENQIEIVCVTEYYKMFDEDLTKYDLVISTIPIHGELEIPHINISQIINEDDLDTIQNYISYVFDSFRPELHFHPKLYKDHVKAKSAKSIINEFYKTLKTQYPHINESFKNNLIIKNQSTLVTFKNKIACIRLSKPLNKNSILSIVVLDKSILINKDEIQLFILFSCQDSDNYIYNSLSNIFNSLPTDSKDVEEFFKKPSYTSFITLLTSNE